MGRNALASFLSVPGTKSKEPTTTTTSNDDNVIASSLDAVPERPKIALRSPFWGVSYILHLVALGLTIAVLQLSFRRVYFADVGAKVGGLQVEESLKAIQFAAKLHEIFMVASLAAIVSHLTRSCLLGKRGVPLGLVSAPFKVGSLDYICSREFFASITPSYAVFSLGILLSTIFALGLGPASAMALVPSLGWWNVESPFSGLDLPIYVDRQNKDFWPHTVTAKEAGCQSGLTAGLCQIYGYEEIMPWAIAKIGTGRSANITMIEMVGGAGRRLQAQTEEMTNKTSLSYLPHMSDLNSMSETEQARFQSYLETTGVTTLATTASHWVTMVLGGFWTYANSVNLGLINRSARPKLQFSSNDSLYEPLVSVRCAAYDFNASIESSESLTAPYVRNIFGTTGFTENTTAYGWPVPSSAWNFTRPPNAVNFTWVDMDGLGVNASAGGVFSLPIATASDGGPNNSMGQQQGSLVVPCTVEARWVASGPIYDPALSTSILVDNITDPLVFAHDAAKNISRDPVATYGASPVLNLTNEWLEKLNGPSPNPEIKSRTGFLPGANTSIVDIIDMFVLTSTINNMSTMLDISTTGTQVSLGVTPDEYIRSICEITATVLGFVVADSLSRLNYLNIHNDIVYSRNSTTASRASLTYQWEGGLGKWYNVSHAADPVSEMDRVGTYFNLNVQRWGYGYGIETKASQFSISMLLLYGCIVVIYIIWFNVQNVIRPRSDWSMVTNRWANISEMLALAINSPPSSKLDGTCAGVEDKRSLKQVMRIRENEDRHLALVVGEERDEHPRVQRDVQYG